METELWNVYDGLNVVDDAVEKATLQLKSLELMVKIRVAGPKVKGVDGGEDAEPMEPSVAKARRSVNGVRP